MLLSVTWICIYQDKHSSSLVFPVSADVENFVELSWKSFSYKKLVAPARNRLVTTLPNNCYISCQHFKEDKDGFFCIQKIRLGLSELIITAGDFSCHDSENYFHTPICSLQNLQNIVKNWFKAETEMSIAIFSWNSQMNLCQRSKFYALFWPAWTLEWVMMSRQTCWRLFLQQFKHRQKQSHSLIMTMMIIIIVILS